MSFSQHLVLWLHVTFVAFTIGPVTVAIMSTPRYIRQRDVRIVRYLSRMTFAFTIASLGVAIAGMFLAQMLSKAAKPWVIASATLFLVAILLLALIVRDQRKAIKALEHAAAQAPAQDATQSAIQPATGSAHEAAGAETAGTAADAEEDAEPGAEHGSAAQQADTARPGTGAGQVATVERGRIAMIGGVVSVIWLVILVLMVWNS
ncbi:MAG TPA: hypothetical protein VF834_17290 [Streptosporangiaceae bacterium]